MKLVKDVFEMTELAKAERAKGRKIAFVPTMGYLHAGHIKLIEKGREAVGKDGLLSLSIFVNPTQFGPKEDFNSYPRDVQRDLKLAQGAGVDAAFIPDAGQMYPEGFKTFVIVEGLSERLCGASRPGHFNGVATVVVKLFNIVLPHIAVFGKKDFQQLALIKRLNADLNLGIEIVGVETVRDKDGLALSSRNTYLSPEERLSALIIPAALDAAKEAFEKGTKDAKAVAAIARSVLGKEPLLSVEYVSVVDAETLEDVLTIKGNCVMAIAVRVGSTRLIDNIQLSC